MPSSLDPPRDTTPKLYGRIWLIAAALSKLGASVHAVWRVLRREGIYLQPRRSWCVSSETRDRTGIRTPPTVCEKAWKNASINRLDVPPSLIGAWPARTHGRRCERS